MEALTQRLIDVNQQLDAIERIIEEENSNAQSLQQNLGQDLQVQRSAVEQLQTGMMTVSESLSDLQDRQERVQLEDQQWKTEIQQHLESLASIVSEIKEKAASSNQAEILDAVQSLQQTQQLNQNEIRDWQHTLQEQLNSLENRLNQARSSNSIAAIGECFQQTPSEIDDDDGSEPADPTSSQQPALYRLARRTHLG
jgi:chromosome segregation ATPase